MDINISKDFPLRDYLRTIFKYKYIIITAVILVMSANILRSELITPKYMATVKMQVVGSPQTEIDHYKRIVNPRGFIDTHTEVIKSKTVLDRVVKALKLYKRPIDEEKKYSSKLKAVFIEYQTREAKQQIEEMEGHEREAMLSNLAVERLRSNINFSYDETSLSFIFMINVMDYNPNAAREIANAVSRSLVIFDLENQIAELEIKYGEKHSSVVRLQKYVDNLLSKLDGKVVSDLEALGPASIKIIEQAKGSVPVGGGSKTKHFMALFASILFGIFIAFIFDMLDQTFKIPQDVVKYLNIPVIGSLPKRKLKDERLLNYTNNSDTSDFKEFYQAISDQLYLLMNHGNLKSLLFMSLENSKKSPYIIANLSVCMACTSGHRVLVVDADIAKPLMSDTFKISNSLGLMDVLSGKVPFDDAIQPLHPNLYILPTGQTVTNSVSFLASSKISELIKQAEKQFDIVLINCADQRNITDTVALSSNTDGTVLVINEREIRHHVASTAISPLKQKGANIIGAIFNNRTYLIPEIIYKMT